MPGALRTAAGVIFTVAISALPVYAQPARLTMTACELFAELDLYPSNIKSPSLIDDYLGYAVKQIYERARSDRDPRVRDASRTLLNATLRSTDYGERFAGADRRLEQRRRDMRDGMTAMVQACNPREPGRAITPSEADAQTRRAAEQAPGAKCETKVYGGGAAVTVCE